MADLETDLAETLLPCQRVCNREDPDANIAGGVGDDELHTVDQPESDQQSPDRDCWLIEGDYLVRRHVVPRATPLSPIDVPLDPPHIGVKNIEVLRVTKPRFSGTP